MIIAVRPPGAFTGSTLLKNGLFAASSYQHVGDATHWLLPYAVLKQRADLQNIRFVTEDMADLASASVLYFMDIPTNLDELRQIRQAHPHLKLVVQLVESLSGRMWTLNPANHRLFDAVVSYDDNHRGRAKYFVHRLPAGGIDGWQGPILDLPFEDRRMACMATVYKPVESVWPKRTGLFMMGHGWQMTLSEWWNYISDSNSLNGARHKVAIALSMLSGDSFDLFGPGWAENGPRKVIPCARGPQTGSKLRFMGGYRFAVAFENCTNRNGYISEKLFDALLAGTVPIYLGNKDIHHFVPKAAFVDARNFDSFDDLAQFIRAMPEQEWREMRDAGVQFVLGDAITIFGQDQFIDAVLGAINYSVGQ